MSRTISVVVGLIAIAFVGCASAPESRPDQRALEARADATVQTFTARDPSLRAVLARAPGYVVFPEVSEGGFVVGGSGGVGVVYENDRVVGYVELTRGTIGAQAGGQEYSQIILFESQAALDRLKAGNFDLSADVTATAIQSGAAESARFEDGVAVLIDDESGLMAGASVGGQQLSYRAK